MHVSGTTTLTAKANGVECNITAIVSKDLQEDLLISCNDLKTLKVIPREFPTAICNAVDSRDIQAEIINAYTDIIIISDELNPIPMQTGGNMHISLVDNSKPFKITTSRRVPLRFEKEANKVVEDLIAKQVIVPVKETTEWCSPAFFVPKADGIKMRLVTDYTQLNKYVKRPVHPFPSTRDILQAIPKEAKIFAKLHRCSPRLFPIGPRRRELNHNYIPIATRKIQILESTHGTKCFIRRVVLPLRSNNGRISLG